MVKFEKSADSRANKFFLVVDCMFGDADGYDKVEIDLSDSYVIADDTFSKDFSVPIEIMQLVDKYKIIRDMQEEDACIMYSDVEEAHGEDVAELFSDIPWQPEMYGDVKCAITGFYLLGYDQSGTEYKARL